jgi:hypothetical protein
LHFSLLRLQLVELIRTCMDTPGSDITPALDFATAQLAPRAPTNPQFLADLERTLALLIFPSDKLDSSLASLLDPALRKEIATRVNEAILQNQGARKEARLRNLVKTRAYAEQKAREAKKDIPDTLDIGLVGDSHDNSNSNDLATNIRDTLMSNNSDVDPMISWYNFLKLALIVSQVSPVLSGGISLLFFLAFLARRLGSTFLGVRAMVSRWLQYGGYDPFAIQVTFFICIGLVYFFVLDNVFP